MKTVKFPIKSFSAFIVLLFLYIPFFPTISFADQDITPPKIVSLELILPNKPVLDVDDTIYLRGKIDDDHTVSGMIGFTGPYGQSSSLFIRTSPALNGYFEAKFTLHSTRARGKWKMNYIYLSDGTNNNNINSNQVSRRYDLNKFSFDFGYKGIDYNITNYNHDLTPVFNGTAKLNGIDFISGTTISKSGSYTLNITEPNGDHTTLSFLIDKEKPVITGAANRLININSLFNPKTNIEAKDNIDGDITRAIKVLGYVNTKKKGIYILTYTVADRTGNVTTVTRKITVIDNVKPVITGATNKTIKLKSIFNSKIGVTAVDNVDGNLTNKVKITGTVNTKKKGVYTLLYSVSDTSGNKTVVTRKITVK